MPSLYEPIDLCDLQLRNRVFMAPLTRNRALADGTPGPWAATYYGQRASAGLIITEAKAGPVVTVSDPYAMAYV